MLLIEYSKFDPEHLRIAGRRLHLPAYDGRGLDSEQQTSSTVWDSSVILAKFLEKHRLVDGRKCLELGAGRGVVGLCCGILNAEMVIMTDVEQAVQKLRIAIECNRLTNVEAQVLDWHEPYQFNCQFDYILLADVVWVSKLVQPLLDTLDSLHESNSTKILMAHQTRSILCDQQFFDGLRGKGFHFTTIAKDMCDPIYVKDSVTIYEISRLR
jgi:predicted nicotinamide N-methyase